jgi:hypothetical protein
MAFALMSTWVPTVFEIVVVACGCGRYQGRDPGCRSKDVWWGFHRYEQGRVIATEGPFHYYVADHGVRFHDRFVNHVGRGGTIAWR